MIVIVGSRKFSQEIISLTKYLQNQNINVVSAPYPDIEYNDTLTSQWADKGLVYDHLYKLKKANYCFIYNPNGYVGVNTIFEIGFFLNTKKPIISSFKTNETCIDMFVEKNLSSINKEDILKELKKLS